tara:strand:+ start:6815 stop:7816 length:1002 start_codon:yes stop_codon:yes gene_type:complete
MAPLISFIGFGKPSRGYGLNKKPSAGGVFRGIGGYVAAGVAAGGYRYHYFREPGSFALDPGYNGDTTGVEILVIAGGGGGGTRTGGGGGAGGIAHAQAIPPGTIPTGAAGSNITITVGDPGSRNAKGGDSGFGTSSDPYYIFALGGGGGGTDGQEAEAGGSGGGGHYGRGGGAGNQPSQNPGKPWVTNYGNAGSAGRTPHPWESGAGGGAGGSASGGGPGYRGAAGSGQDFPTFSSPTFMPSGDPWYSAMHGRGSYVKYGGGGGAGSYPPYAPDNMPAAARQGGGGRGGRNPEGSAAQAGRAGTGGGGGGAAYDPQDANVGGNGMVVIRYPDV